MFFGFGAAGCQRTTFARLVAVIGIVAGYITATEPSKAFSASRWFRQIRTERIKIANDFNATVGRQILPLIRENSQKYGFFRGNNHVKSIV